MPHMQSDFFANLRRSSTAFAAVLLLAACSATPQPEKMVSYKAPETELLFDAAFIMPDDISGVDESPETFSASDTPDGTAEADSGEFQVASVVGENTLSDMRGGFVSAGGLNINFGLTSTTLVNGTLASSLNLSSTNSSGLIPQNLEQVVQVGSSNTFNASSTTLGNNVVTLVQNNTNGTVIQSTNVLNITVSNFAHLQNSMALASSIGPLVRSLH